MKNAIVLATLMMTGVAFAEEGKPATPPPTAPVTSEAKPAAETMAQKAKKKHAKKGEKKDGAYNVKKAKTHS